MMMAGAFTPAMASQAARAVVSGIVATRLVDATSVATTSSAIVLNVRSWMIVKSRREASSSIARAVPT